MIDAGLASPPNLASRSATALSRGIAEAAIGEPAAMPAADGSVVRVTDRPAAAMATADAYTTGLRRRGLLSDTSVLLDLT
jgi:hypothetical protein